MTLYKIRFFTVNNIVYVEFKNNNRFATTNIYCEDEFLKKYKRYNAYPDEFARVIKSAYKKLKIYKILLKKTKSD